MNKITKENIILCMIWYAYSYNPNINLFYLHNVIWRVAEEKGIFSSMAEKGLNWYESK